MLKRVLDWLDWNGPILVFFGGLLFIVAGLPYLVELSVYVSAEAEIEQLRSDISLVEGRVSEDIAGQATEWNQTIRSKQRWNDVPLIQVFVPNGWDEVELLRVDTGR